MRESTFALDSPAGTISGSAAPAAPLAKQIVQGTDGERLSFNGGKLAKAPADATRSLGASEGSGGESTSPAAATSRSGSVVRSDSVVVVHLVAKPEAFANKSLDKLLAKRGIEVESVPAADKSERAAEFKSGVGQLVDRRPGDTSANDASAKRADEEVDFVLVDAPAPTVELFLSDLKDDSTNYVGVEVESPTESDDAESKVAKLRSQAPDLRRYSRGVVAPAQKDAWRYYYGEVAKAEQDKPTIDRLDSSPRSAGPSGSAAPDALAEREKVAESRSRALRISPSEAMQLQPESARGRRASEPIAEESRVLRRAEAEPNESGELSDRVQVLIVVSPERAADSAPAAKPAE